MRDAISSMSGPSFLVKGVHGNIAIPANFDRDSAEAAGTVDGPGALLGVELALLGGEACVVGGEDDPRGDGGDELARCGFGAAVVGGDEDVGLQDLRALEQFALGGFLDVGGEE